MGDLSQMMSLARDVFGRQQGQVAAKVSTLTAASESSGGYVDVYAEGDSGDTVTIPVIGHVAAGDSVTAIVQAGGVQAVGSYGSGDSMENRVRLAEGKVQHITPDETGLYVHENEESFDEGANMRLTSEGLEIRDGEDVMASFSESDIYLGGSDSKPAIHLCGGKGKIEYDPYRDGIEISSPQNVYLYVDDADSSVQQLSGFNVWSLGPSMSAFSKNFITGDFARAGIEANCQAGDIIISVESETDGSAAKKWLAVEKGAVKASQPNPEPEDSEIATVKYVNGKLDDYPLTTLAENQYYKWRFWKKNGIVTVYGRWSGNTSSWFSENQATLPEGCRPPIELWFSPVRDNAGASYTGECAAIVYPSGIITVSNRGGAQDDSQRTWSFSFAV